MDAKIRRNRADGNETRQILKATAQRLFALHGVDGISIKDILAASGQRNNTSLHYHFGSKEALIAELLSDGAKQIDAIRQSMLDELERGGRALRVRDVLKALVLPVNELTERRHPENTYIRFVANLQMNHRALFREALGDTWNVGYRRCLEHLRGLLGEIPAPLLEQRMSMVGIYANAIFAAKEAALDEVDAPNRLWAPAHTLENILDTLQAVLESRPSKSTLRLLESA